MHPSLRLGFVTGLMLIDEDESICRHQVLMRLIGGGTARAVE